ncbi:DUF4258 domain-containing protein [Candidatus Woesearchaeota archaeon]|nr:DUF4258 domain-containing protein [Candidatus Woesearchaeota archaeon]
MQIIYSDHAKKRMRQRGMTELEIEHILSHAMYIKKSFDGTKEAAGIVKHRAVRIKFIEIENYIKIITVM